MRPAAVRPRHRRTVDRVKNAIFYEVWDPSADKTWRVVSLAGGGYTVELDVDDVTLVHESHSSFADAVARTNGLREETNRP